MLLFFPGHVKLKDYIWYWKSQGIWLLILFFVFWACFQGSQIFGNILLSNMSGDEELKEIGMRAFQRILRENMFRFAPNSNSTRRFPPTANANATSLQISPGGPQILYGPQMMSMQNTSQPQAPPSIGHGAVSRQSASLAKMEELLAKMTDDEKTDVQKRVSFYMTVYLLMGLVQMAFNVASSVVFTFMVVNSSRVIHKLLLGIFLNRTINAAF